MSFRFVVFSLSILVRRFVVYFDLHAKRTAAIFSSLKVSERINSRNQIKRPGKNAISDDKLYLPFEQHRGHT